MESTTDFEGQRYALAHPVDIPVIIATAEDEEEGLHAIEEDEDIDPLFEPAREALAQEGFELKRTPFMLTVEEDEGAFDLDDMGDVDDGDLYDDDEDELDFEELADGAEVLAKFFHKGQQYYIAEPLEPTFIIAKQLSGTRFSLLSDEEMENVKPMLEQAFVDINEAFFEEDAQGA